MKLFNTTGCSFAGRVYFMNFNKQIVLEENDIALSFELIFISLRLEIGTVDVSCLIWLKIDKVHALGVTLVSIGKQRLQVEKEEDDDEEDGSTCIDDSIGCGFWAWRFSSAN